MSRLDMSLSKKLQEALDNPLAKWLDIISYVLYYNKTITKKRV
jgi:hypothetical protein